MSMNTPLGQILTTKNIKDFEELEQLQAEQYIVAIADNTAGRGGKIKATKLSSSMISTDADNQLIIGSDNKLYAKMSSITDVIDAQNMYETGRVLTDERGLNQLKQMKHSTFDLSKFTVVGTPTITDDGIASGFNTNSYLKLPTNIQLHDANSWTIEVEFDTKNNYGLSFTQDVIDASNHSLSPFYIFQDGTMKAHLSSNGTSWNIIGGLTLLNIQDFTHYKLKCSFTGSAYNFYQYIDNEWQLLNSFESSVKVASYDNLIIGKNSRNNIDYFAGTIDLKTLSITVDGVEVFNGNKTGIDQITNKDDYTVVGSPVISADGVASGFSSSNYLTIINPITNTANFVIETEFTTGNNDGYQAFFATAGNAPRGVYIQIDGSNNIEIYLSSAGHDWDLLNQGLRTALTTYTKYWLKLSVINTIVTLYLSTDGKNYTSKSTTISGQINSNFQPVIGRNFHGTVDLNSFKIYSDNQLVYQPTLRIPYTQSKTGSKIVDVVYRDRVQYMYDQFGYAPYYTLSDTDFTLPMGEIYGMINRIENNKADKTELGMKADKTELDGNFVQKDLRVAEGINFDGTNKTYSLSDYLPYDNNIYEIYGYSTIVTGNVSGNSSAMTLSSDLCTGLSVCRANTRTSNTSITSGYFSIPIGNSKELIMSGNSTSGSYYIVLTGYRRIK